MLFRVWACAAAMACGLWCAGARSATPAPFTQEQADSGRQEFMTSCAACHGDHLQGVSGPALSGATFAASWGKHTAIELYAFIQSTMPLCEGGALSNEAYMNIVAFILRENGAQPGPNPLSQENNAQIGDVIKAAGAPAGPN